jgi:uncharacterized protein DUF4177
LLSFPVSIGGSEMGFLRKDTDERAAKASAKAIADQLQAEAREREREQREAAEIQDRAFVESFPKWEYQVVRIGEDKQKGLLGSRPMEQILNDEGRKGWELVTVNEERATFKRRIS